MSAWLLMNWRVLIYCSDYKHPHPRVAQPQTRGVDTPRLHTVILRYTMDSLGRARHTTHYTNNITSGSRYKVDELQYNGPSTIEPLTEWCR